MYKAKICLVIFGVLLLLAYSYLFYSVKVHIPWDSKNRWEVDSMIISTLKDSCLKIEVYDGGPPDLVKRTFLKN